MHFIAFAKDWAKYCIKL